MGSFKIRIVNMQKHVGVVANVGHNMIEFFMRLHRDAGEGCSRGREASPLLPFSKGGNVGKGALFDFREIFGCFKKSLRNHCRFRK